MELNYIVTNNCIHIEDSYKIKDKTQIADYLNEIQKQYPNNNVFINRNFKALVCEWYVHSKMYNFWLAKKYNSNLKDVDLEFPLLLNGKKVTDNEWVIWSKLNKYFIAFLWFIKMLS